MSIMSAILLLLDISSTALLSARSSAAVTALMEDLMLTMTNQAEGRGKSQATIFVNTREFDWVEKEISYEQVYALAYPDEPLNEGDVVRVEYSRGHNGSGAGALQPGGAVKVKKGMVFDVYVTVRS